MNSDITNKIDELFDELKKSNLYKNYVSAKKQLESNNEIINIINEIKRLQKIAVNNKDDVVEKELKELYKKLDSYPLYQSYIGYKEELENELKIISKEFNSYFYEILRLED